MDEFKITFEEHSDGTVTRIVGETRFRDVDYDDECEYSVTGKYWAEIVLFIESLYRLDLSKYHWD
jgi:hypothetical protein